MVACFRFVPTYSRMRLNQMASQVELVNALYPAYVDDKETFGCFLLLHDTTPEQI